MKKGAKRTPGQTCQEFYIKLKTIQETVD